MLVDTGGVVLLSTSGPVCFICREEIRTVLREALASGEPLLTDLHAGEAGGTPHFSLVLPINGSPTDAPHPGGIVLVLDPEDFLFPLVESWPVPSRTAETLIVRAEGDSVRFLNEPRHVEDPGFSLMLPLTRTEVPAVQAVLGRTGILQSTDYRGVEVLSVIAPVEGSSWLMVSKIDRAEALDGWGLVAGLIIGMTGITLLAVVTSIFVLWQHSERLQYRRLLEAEGEIRKLNVELEQRVGERTAQLEATNNELESFTYSVSHDLRAPLRHVQGYVEMLARETDGRLSDSGRHYMKTIADASRDMGDLIDDLLAFSRMGRTDMLEKNLDLNTLVQDALRELDWATQERNIVWKIPPLPAVHADPAMLKMALINLLGNAIKFTRPRETAEIEMGSAGMEDGRVILFVRDNGVGFDPDYAHKLFGVFQRLHRSDEFEGTGIGLANVRRIISRHGGRTWAEGRINEGAAFYFTLKPLSST
jgi:signal transduction histidine kinase